MGLLGSAPVNLLGKPSKARKGVRKPPWSAQPLQNPLHLHSTLPHSCILQYCTYQSWQLLGQIQHQQDNTSFPSALSPHELLLYDMFVMTSSTRVAAAAPVLHSHWIQLQVINTKIGTIHLSVWHETNSVWESFSILGECKIELYKSLTGY